MLPTVSSVWLLRVVTVILRADLLVLESGTSIRHISVISRGLLGHSVVVSSLRRMIGLS